MARPGRSRKHDPIADDIARYIRGGEFDDARSLIENASVDILDGEARTPLIHAALNNAADFLAWLIEMGANLNHQDRIGYSALHFAAQECHLEIAELLLRNSANPNVPDRHGNGPLWTASHEASLANRTDQHLQMVALLLRSGADAQHRNNHGRSPYDVGTRCDDPPLNCLFVA